MMTMMTTMTRMMMMMMMITMVTDGGEQGGEEEGTYLIMCEGSMGEGYGDKLF